MNKNLVDRTILNARQSDNYEGFQKGIQQMFSTLDKVEKMFRVKVDKPLYEIYLENIPEWAREHYVCRTCKHFFERYGNLVVVNENGNLISAIWDEEYVPEFWVGVTKALRLEVEKGYIESYFVPSSKNLGEPETNGWEHLHLVTKDLFRNDAEVHRVREEVGMIQRGIERYSLENAIKAVALLETGDFYRADRVIGSAKWFKKTSETLSSITNDRVKHNMTWLEASHAPNGFAHINNSMLGSLLDDIASGMSVMGIKASFEDKMDPNRYGRAQSAPSAGSIAQAEKRIKELNMETAIQRRFARIEEIPAMLWTTKNAEFTEIKRDQSSGVFANVTPKGKSTEKVGDLELPATVMTWSKFERTILPSAEAMEVKVDSNRLMSLVTALDENAPNLFQWSNPFSWYYKNGIDADMRTRVMDAGGRYDNCAVRCTLAWGSYTDLDLHCYINNSEIAYNHKRANGGELDVDMNAGGGQTLKPVENIRFINLVNGNYEFFVHNFADRSETKYKGFGQSGSTEYAIELEVNGQVYRTSGIVSDRNKDTCFTFKIVNGKVVNLVVKGKTASGDQWSVTDDSFVKVAGICKSPNLWGENKLTHIGDHTFFLLNGCKDSVEVGKGRGFFTETLIPELREIRKVLEAYTANMNILDVENSTASGVGYSKDRDWDLVVKVRTAVGTQLIKIDRFE